MSLNRLVAKFRIWLALIGVDFPWNFHLTYELVDELELLRLLLAHPEVWGEGFTVSMCTLLDVRKRLALPGAPRVLRAA